MRLLSTLLMLFVFPVSGPAAEPHWAFQPPQRPTVSGHPVDALLAAPRPPVDADRRTLLRRITLDLTGVPPTPAEMQAFLADESSNAYEKVVDRLLMSPRYGERWGRHWMDVWRYSDWDGYGAEVRNSQPHIWRWRDWIVQSLNADKGYDRMVLEMLAGDELAPDDPDIVRATGFLARNWFKFNRNVWLENTVEHTAKAFLGLTMNCARCHDHKYDPITQPEYFQFRAFFEPHDVRIDRVPGQPDLTKDGVPRVYDAKLDAPTHLFHRGDEAKPDKSKSLSPGLPRLFNVSLKIEPVTLSVTAQCPDKRSFVAREELARAESQLDAARARQKTVKDDALRLAQSEVALAEARLRALKAVLRMEALEADEKTNGAEWEQAARETVTLQRIVAIEAARHALLPAELERKRATAKPQIDAAEKKIAAAKDVLAKAEAAAKAPVTTAYAPRVKATFPATSSGRRLALARWIVSPQNPLTARVAVNHLWARHFGRPLVASMFDFGVNGAKPTHPQLLDYLATELVRQGWRMKPVHRLLVTSAAYRARTEGPESSWQPRRLEAEAVRDSVLFVTGNLDPTMGGPELDQKLGLTSTRRSLYFRHSVEKYVEMLKVFDAPNVVECYRRDESVVPQQALALANNPLVLAQARQFARTLHALHPAPDAFIAAAFENILGRPPRSHESAECAMFLTEQARLLGDRSKLSAFVGPACPTPPSVDPTLRAREDLVHVLFNHHEFVTLK